MYHKVRITVVSLVVVMACMLSSNGTLSYFTDTQGVTNSFVVGNASTVLALYDDVSNASNKRSFDASRYTVTDNLNVPLYLQATNNGNIPVYQRFRVVIPAALASVVTLNLPNMNNCAVETSAEHVCSNDDYIVEYDASANNGEYAEYYIMGKDEIAVNGTTAEWPTDKLVLGDVPEAGDPIYTCGVSENDCAFGIAVYSDAIQTTGFVNVKDAFASLGETYNH